MLPKEPSPAGAREGHLVAASNTQALGERRNFFGAIGPGVGRATRTSSPTGTLFSRTGLEVLLHPGGAGTVGGGDADGEGSRLPRTEHSPENSSKH